MTRATIIGGAFATILVLLNLLNLAGGHRDQYILEPARPTMPAVIPANAQAHGGLLYGRVTTEDGAIYEGRLRFGGDEEALWGNYFNGAKDDNPWVAHADIDELPKERYSIGIFGIELIARKPFDVGRPFMARFGDLARIEAQGRDLQVTLKSGTVFHLDRWAADDFADGVRVWDDVRGVVDLGERQIRSVEFLPTAQLGSAPSPLYGTVRTRRGDYTGFVQWDRKACVGGDVLDGHTADGEVSLRFNVIRSIARRSSEGALVTLLDGREVLLSATRRDGRRNSGMYVDDQRYGRVLISWDAFERVDFEAGGTGPAYDDFPLGRPLTGTVVTRSGRRLAGRLVYDLDESETTETLDAPSQGVDYTILFGLIASIQPLGVEQEGAQGATVTLHSGEELQLERAGDLSERNAGILIFVGGHQRPEYVPWTDVEQITFERPPDMLPSTSIGGTS